MAKRGRRRGRKNRSERRTGTSGWLPGDGLDVSVVPRVLVEAVNGAEVLAIGVLQLTRNVLTSVVSGTADLGTVVISRAAGAARGVVGATSQIVGDAAGVATNTVRTTMSTAKDVGAQMGQAIKRAPGKTTSSRPSEVETPAAARGSKGRPRRKRERESEPAAA